MIEKAKMLEVRGLYMCWSNTCYKIQGRGCLNLITILIIWMGWDCDCIALHYYFIKYPNGFSRNLYYRYSGCLVKHGDDEKPHCLKVAEFMHCKLTQFKCRCLYEHCSILTFIHDFMIKEILWLWLRLCPWPFTIFHVINKSTPFKDSWCYA